MVSAGACGRPPLAVPLLSSLPRTLVPSDSGPGRTPLLSAPPSRPQLVFITSLEALCPHSAPSGLEFQCMNLGRGTQLGRESELHMYIYEHSLISYGAPATPGGRGPLRVSLGDRIAFKPVWSLPAQKHRLLGGRRGSGKASLRRAAGAVVGCGLRDTVNCVLLHHRVPRRPGTKEVSCQSHSSNT